jgi:hypothetical protein
MKRRPERSGALLIGVYVDMEATPRWHARLLSYPNAIDGSTTVEYMTTIDEITARVRGWLEVTTRRGNTR